METVRLKFQVFLPLVVLLLLLAPHQILSAPRPRPAAQPAPFSPGLKIGALAGAALVIKGEAVTGWRRLYNVLHVSSPAYKCPVW